MNYISISQAAKDKDVSRPAIYFAIKSKTLDMDIIAGKTLVVLNERYYEYKRRRENNTKVYKNKSLKTIYALADPVTKEIRYIGCAFEVFVRYGVHLRNNRIVKRDSLLKYNWIKSLKDKKLKPLLIILEKVNAESAKEAEMVWMKFYHNKVNLTNIRTPDNKPLEPERINLSKRQIGDVF